MFGFKRSPEDLYNILGVKPTAPQDEIAQAWRRLARQHHPDKGGDSEQFKAIRRAYDILRTASKRKIYDRFGMAGLENSSASSTPYNRRQSTAGSYSPFNLFNMFREKASLPHFKEQNLPKSPSVQFPLKIRLEDMFVGYSKRIKMTRQIPCEACNGSGCRYSSSDNECLTCNGLGAELTVDHVMEPGGGILVEQKHILCQTCDGLGILIARDQRCLVCDGKRVQSQTGNLTINVPAGSRNGDQIVMEGTADQLPNHLAGDLIIVVHEIKHDRFRRVRDDIAISHTIQLVEALTGFKILIPHLDGRILRVSSELGLIYNPKSMIVVHGEGMPTAEGARRSRGNLYIELDIQFPLDGFFGIPGCEKLRAVLPKLKEQFKVKEHERLTEVNSSRVNRDPYRPESIFDEEERRNEDPDYRSD